MILFLLAQAWAWQIAGPERGHVLDADIGEEEVLVTTRVGVMRADPQLTKWERDSRFPPETKRVAVWKKGAWAAPPTQLWEILEDGSMELIKQFDNAVVTDLDAREDGVVFLGLRGKQKGLWRIEPGGKAVELSSSMEPWVILADGRDIWVGTLAHGLWSSEKGQPFSQVSTGSVTAIERVGSHIWVGYSDGQILDAHTQALQAKIKDGFATRIAALDEDTAFLTVASPLRKAHPFQILRSGALTDIGEVKVDGDAGFVGGTGAWSLRDGTAMIGTFRRGPLRWNGSLVPERTGFQAMVSTGGAIDRYGQLVMAFMGTGVYRWKDDVVFSHDPEGPVTDSIVVRSVLDTVVVLDFEGIKILQEDGSWERMTGRENLTKGIRNSFRDIGRSADGTWWALDAQGIPWMRSVQEEKEEWERCQLRGIRRFEGDGADLLFVGDRGYFLPECTQQQIVRSTSLDTKHYRSWGKWLAGDGVLVFEQQKVFELPDGKVDVLVPDGEGVLLSVRETPLLYCETSCEEIAPAVSEPLVSIGRVPDGRIWALEESGTLLIDDGTENIPSAWHSFTEHRVQFNGVMRYYSDPWINGQAGFTPPQFLRSKRYSLRYWIWLSALVCGAIFFYRLRRKKK